jgi:hypothetical protein
MSVTQIVQTEQVLPTNTKIRFNSFVVIYGAQQENLTLSKIVFPLGSEIFSARTWCSYDRMHKAVVKWSWEINWPTTKARQASNTERVRSVESG